MRIRVATLLLAALAVVPSRAGTAPFAFAGGDPNPKAPGVHIDAPDEGAVLGRSIRVAGHVVGVDLEASPVVRVNGTEVAVKDGRFETTIEGKDDGRGPFHIRVLHAAVGVPAEVAERDVWVDLEPPTVVVTEPPGPVGVFPRGEGRVSGKATDKHFRDLRMNGAIVPVEPTGEFSAVFVLPADGEVRVEVVATDAVGNVSLPIVRVLRTKEPETPEFASSPSTIVVSLEVAADGKATWRGAGGAFVDLGDLATAGAATTQAVDGAARELAALLASTPRVASEAGRSSVALDLRLGSGAPVAPLEPLLRTAADPTAGAPRVRLLAVGKAPGAEAPPEKDVLSISVTEPRQEGQQPWASRVRVASWSWGLPTIGWPLGAPPLPTAARARKSVLEEIAGVLKRAATSSGARGARLVAVGAQGRAWPDDLLGLAAAARTAGLERVVLVATVVPESAEPPEAPPPGPPAPPSTARPPTPPPAPPPAAVATESAPLRPDWLKRRAGRVGLLEEGGNAKTEAAVEAALAWLAAHQSADGRWESAGFSAWCSGKPTTGAGPGGLGKPGYDVGVTGLALLAFLGAGRTDRDEHAYAKTVAAGLKYLRSVQDAEGCFGERTSGHFVYNHAIATQAAVEAYALTGSPIHRASAQKALDFVAIARNPYFAWRYGVKSGENDTSVTGWMMTALKSAKLIDAAEVKAGKTAPLLIDEDAFDGIKTWIEKMTDPDYGRVGYIQRGTGPARPADLVDKFPAQKSESMTGVAMLARIFLGEDPRNSDMIQKGAELCSKLVPTWNPKDGSIDMYYWYYATLAMFQVGGPEWKAWSDALHTAVAESQRRDTDPCMYRGSWDPIDPWGADGGRVYSTALCALILETYYRFPRLWR